MIHTDVVIIGAGSCGLAMCSHAQIQREEKHATPGNGLPAIGAFLMVACSFAAGTDRMREK